MMRSLFAGVSGLRNHQVRMDVIGNNIANVNTYGFKLGRVAFQDVISQTIQGASAPQGDRGGINPKQVGLGMKIASIDNIFNQGGLEATANLTDLAIDGEGFFILRDGTSTHYTRAGMFTVDAGQTLVHSANGFAVQGWNTVIIDPSTGASSVDTSQPVGDLEIVQGQKLEARASTNVVYASNLDAAALGSTAAAREDLGIELTNNAGINLNLSIGSQVRVDPDVTTPLTYTTLTVATSDGTASDGQFATLAGLAEEIETVLQATSATVQVSISGTGTMVISNLTGAGSAQLNFSIGAVNSTASAPIANFNNVFSVVSGVLNVGENLATSTLRVASHQTSIITYDSLGTQHNLTVVFAKTSTPNVWTWEANLPSTDTALASLAGNNGTLAFGSDGLLISSTGGPITFSPPGADSVTITPNFDGNGVPINGVTQFASASTTSAKTQDGYDMGVLESFDIDISGTVTGFFSNGLNQAIGQIALARFVNNMGLNKIGATLFDATPNSGVAEVVRPSSPGNGEIASGFLEMSNVDLANEFTNMIITQRGFQANARTITTSDQMLQELMGLKR